MGSRHNELSEHQGKHAPTRCATIPFMASPGLDACLYRLQPTGRARRADLTNPPPIEACRLLLQVNPYRSGLSAFRMRRSPDARIR
jgi:hypothetical protein